MKFVILCTFLLLLTCSWGKEEVDDLEERSMEVEHDEIEDESLPLFPHHYHHHHVSPRSGECGSITPSWKLWLPSTDPRT